MIPLRIPGATRTLAKDQPEYMQLAICDYSPNRLNIMLSLWEPTPGERKKLLNGGVLAVGTPTKDGSTFNMVVHKFEGSELGGIRDLWNIIVGIPGYAHPPIMPYVVDKGDVTEDMIDTPQIAVISTLAPAYMFEDA